MPCKDPSKRLKVAAERRRRAYAKRRKEQPLREEQQKALREMIEGTRKLHTELEK